MTEKFRDYLIGINFTIFTDNNPLAHLGTVAHLGATEQRWVAQLAAFNYEVKYHAGKEKAYTDALSRIPEIFPQVTDFVNVRAVEEVGVTAQSQEMDLVRPEPAVEKWDMDR